jgi:NAD(P)-dependent dehydrogenase (short-subunit alcohol dehydrogenase family)
VFEGGGDLDQIDAVVQQVRKTLGPILILVHKAAVIGPDLSSGVIGRSTSTGPGFTSAGKLCQAFVTPAGCDR